MLTRVCATLDDSVMINEFGGPRAIVIPLCLPIFEDALVSADGCSSMLKKHIDVIKSNIRDGGIPRDGALIVSVVDLDPPGVDRISIMRFQWKSRGECPKCGHGGEWISLALSCPYHGVYI
jgi:hypothetical protein